MAPLGFELMRQFQVIDRGDVFQRFDAIGRKQLWHVCLDLINQRFNVRQLIVVQRCDARRIAVVQVIGILVVIDQQQAVEGVLPRIARRCAGNLALIHPFAAGRFLANAVVLMLFSPSVIVAVAFT